MATQLHVKKGDRVKVLAGKDKGTIGEIIAIDRKAGRVTVSGVNIVKRHRKDRQDNSGRNNIIKGGILSSEAPIDVSNVALVVRDKNNAEVTTRVRYERRQVTKKRPDGSQYEGWRSVRIAVKTGKEI
ncbi:MAG: 50S ribosomal protein L24 [Propionibacteriaceae bacterium]|jgi:large subunit ribosomal protein L24|nr:50S ribosomal protein L24 [Propionibacteriaceae bacterium]